ncbi:MAG: B12-binding domain-containing radical SAM protein [Candidatus Omnitrophica bacterium]|nr:B12-binding domain-containing radical SAM protein [Candidatus Omnitrophota bacterium]MBU4488718.1 B12-binding domain-containing radical SAM protein [Candidatus Omnitrophota bacterium]MCG2705747.1 B12-binding domain-containing radical SAM protein [Candidatus Omnitrophota bacterium]
MFKIVLISTDESAAALGAKIISANLIKHGFDTSIVLMPYLGDNFSKFHWEDLENICKGANLIGISCMTHGIKKAVEVRKALQKNVKAPVIIGGVHAILDPESAFDSFDFICYGEGEDLIVELADCLANNRSFCDIPGLQGKYQGKIFKNPPQPLSKDINDYPFPDYDLSHQYILVSNRLVPMKFGHITCDSFEVMGSRGCPHSCTYCSNHKINENFPWRKKVRQYTNDYFIAHLKEVNRAYPVIRSFWLEDDTFFAKDTGQIRDFAIRYKKEINKPFIILVSPWTYSEEKVRIMAEAGMDRLIFGIQSGSENVNYNVYNRKIANDKLLEIVRSLSNFKEVLTHYDFIGMNPFETREDLISTIQFIKKFPAPFFIFSNNLAFYPGTKLRERAIEAGLNISHRDRHGDARHGYSVLKNENIKHKLFHFTLLMMAGKSSRVKIGSVPRAFVSDRMLRFYSFLDKKCESFINRCVALLSIIMMHADWKLFLRKHLGRKQIQDLKKIYFNLFK